jgi:hypothetical protein
MDVTIESKDKYRKMGVSWVKIAVLSFSGTGLQRLPDKMMCSPPAGPVSSVFLLIW